MSTPKVPRDLQLPPTQRFQSEFKEQRRQKLKEHLLRRKTMFAYKQENGMSSSRGQKAMTSENQVREGTKALKLKTKMADKENVKSPRESKNDTIGKNCIPLKPNELNNSTTAAEIPNFEDNQTLLLPIKDHSQSQNMTLSRAFHLKNNNNSKHTAAEKHKQDASIPKKPMPGYYRGQIVQSKINSFRKPLEIKDESSATTKNLLATFSKVTKPKPVNTNSVRAPNLTASTKFVNTKSVSTTSQNNTFVQPPMRSHHNNTQSTEKPSISRTPAIVTVRKGPHEKQLLQSKTLLSTVKTSAQDVKREKTSGSITSEVIAKTASSSKTKLMEKPKTTNQRRHTIARATSDRSAQHRETVEERKARLNEWRIGKGKVLKRPPNSVVAQPEPEEQNEKPVESFWTTMVEEDEQRLFTEKVNKTISECLNLIDMGCPKEEILGTLDDLIRNIPDAQKLVKYWICLVRIEPITSPIENIISIYEKAILAGAQPIEEMRNTIIDILTMKTQVKVNLGENVEEGHATKEHIQEVNTEDTSIDLELEKTEMESEHRKNVVFQDCGTEQDNTTKDPVSDIRTPGSQTGAGCIIKYNVSTTPCLQSMRKKMQHDEINAVFKDLKFLTPVRRSQRLQEKTSQLPDMLKDHYPSVSSLEQLSELGGDAFICRPNAALCPAISETSEAGDAGDK